MIFARSSAAASLVRSRRTLAASPHRHLLLLSPYVTHPRQHRQLPEPTNTSGGRRRSLAARATPDGDKKPSWGEILGQAADLAGTAISKVKDSVGKAISSVKGKEEEEEEGSRSPMKQRRPSGLTGFGEGGGGGPLSGLLGRAVGGMVATAVNQIGKQLQAAAEEAEDTYSAASSRVRGSRRLQEALGVGGGGNLQVGPVVSQGVSSSSINGVTSKNINLVFAVFASNGQAAQAQVQLPNGRLLKIDDKDVGGAGPIQRGGSREEVIEAEFKDLK